MIMNPVTADRRHFEDLALGERIEFAAITVTKEMIIEFATEFDPFPFHLDEDAARKSLLGGLASSGWQTAGLSLRMVTDAFLSRVASAGGLGFSDLKWKRPVMKGDTISGSATIAELRRSRSHPQWGIVLVDFDVRNQKGQPVMSMRLANLVETRDPQAGTMQTPMQPYDVEHGGGAG
ncbi:MAG: MaoC family dehydratase [Devosia sp.]|nr:MaoC family dehydratase [Devosia sp.]